MNSLAGISIICFKTAQSRLKMELHCFTIMFTLRYKLKQQIFHYNIEPNIMAIKKLFLKFRTHRRRFISIDIYIAKLNTTS